MPPDPLKAAALRLLARREHSRAELGAKLAARAGGDAEAVGRVLAELAASGLQSDDRVAESVMAAQGHRLGPRRIAQTLRRKGLDEGLVVAGTAQARDGEYERAAALWQQRFGARVVTAMERAAQQREAARQLRFLLARGFSAEVARCVLRSAGRAADDMTVDDGD